jgi:hypothetical protein
MWTIVDPSDGPTDQKVGGSNPSGCASVSLSKPTFRAQLASASGEGGLGRSILRSLQCSWCSTCRGTLGTPQLPNPAGSPPAHRSLPVPHQHSTHRAQLVDRTAISRHTDPPLIWRAAASPARAGISAQHSQCRQQPGGAALARPTGSSSGSGCPSHGYHEAGSSASQLVWMLWVGLQRQHCRQWRMSGHGSADGAAGGQGGAAASTDAGCAQAIVRPGEDCRRSKQCSMTPGTHGIFQC